jgi:hypothetical protein
MPWLALAGTAVSAFGAVESAKFKTAANGALQGFENKPTSQTSEAVFDNSGWNIAFAGSRIAADVDKTTSQRGADSSGAGVGEQGGIIPGIQSALGQIDGTTLMYAGVGFLALMLWKKRKS